ncbi:hypothetical protein [Nostoc sp. CMAA1605]|uniref:hypothetical protein n=1 Tax=Nostoc sp. CMAA1605 TaxID=2055159 RepID=UPI001F19212B|nr:hypothetical protein [Nostoc sp. CMAA1605]MCF4970182.1 hypothetical protein [Nostoc sp. CMAA1605]
MLKPLLLSGWFRVQPFFNYFVVFMLIAPLVAASGHSSSAKTSKVVAKIASEPEESDIVSPEKAAVSEPELARVLTTEPTNSLRRETVVASQVIRPPMLPADDITESLLAQEYTKSHIDNTVVNPLADVELAPSVTLGKTPAQNRVWQESGDNNLLAAVQPLPTISTPQADANQDDVPVSEPQPEQASELPTDPIGSPHPIPWQWIVSTQEAIGSKGVTGVRYYRSVPVVSPDGKYAVYSRVQIDVKPEMYNSKVTSVLFVENRETKQLRVMASTTTLQDPLVKTQTTTTPEDSKEGKIGVLVPVSWSEKSDRFLARRFEGVFNTGDSTDQAVIWDRQKNQANTVAPAQTEEDHEKIAVLLGWSKNEPDHVLFRAGEMGEENWPLVKVAIDGKTGATTESDQPVTFGDKLSNVWAGPQVASR